MAKSKQRTEAVVNLADDLKFLASTTSEDNVLKFQR